ASAPWRRRLGGSYSRCAQSQLAAPLPNEISDVRDRQRILGERRVNAILELGTLADQDHPVRARLADLAMLPMESTRWEVRRIAAAGLIRPSRTTRPS
ncbi:MAG: hypothetical protein ACRDF1_03690, partial [bacterium]